LVGGTQQVVANSKTGSGEGKGRFNLESVSLTTISTGGKVELHIHQPGLKDVAFRNLGMNRSGKSPSRNGATRKGTVTTIVVGRKPGSIRIRGAQEKETRGVWGDDIPL
jgi:hypothetical protein